MALTKEQAAARLTRLGGSDAAAIVGRDPYKTAHEVALRITGQLEPDPSLEDQDHILFGHEIETVLANIYARKNKVVLYEPITLLHPRYSFIAVNIDRRIKGNPEIALEMKNVGGFTVENEGDRWGSPGTDEVPQRIILQCQHGMMVDESIKLFHVLRCHAGNQFQQFVVERNAELIAALEAIEVEFYNNVMVGDLPPPDWEHTTTSDVLRRSFRNVKGIIEDKPELALWTDAWEQAQAQLDRAKVLEESLKNHILHLMGDAAVGVLPDGRKWVRKQMKRAGYVVAPQSYIYCKLTKPRSDRAARIAKLAEQKKLPAFDERKRKV